MSTTDEGKAFVGSDHPQHGGWLRPKYLKIAAMLAGLLLIVASVLLLSANLQKQSKLDLPLDPNAPAEYTSMTPVQVRARLYHDTGLDIEKLSKQKLTARTFKDFSAAYQTAQAFTGLGNYKTAQQVYAIADKKADKTTNYEFYNDYTAIADINGDETAAKAATAQAKRAIQNDSALNKDQKFDLLAAIDDKQRRKDSNL